MARESKGVGIASDTHRFTMPPEWAIEVSSRGVVFLGPEGEEVTVSSSPLNLPSRKQPAAVGSTVQRREVTGPGGQPILEIATRGPSPEVIFRCASPKGNTQALDRLAKALERIEWFPPAKPRPWWRVW